MKIIAMIPARYEASRFPGKLMKDLAGKTVISRTYEAAINANLFDAVYVVTDSDLIVDEIQNIGGLVIKSKKDHKTGSDRIAESVKDLDVDIVVNVQGDEPFINEKALKDLLKAFEGDVQKKIDVASLMIVMEELEAIQNSNNVKVVCDEQNFAMYFSRAPIPFPRDKSRAKYFKHIGIYAFRKSALLRFTKLPMSELEATEKLENLRFLANGMRVKMIETSEHSIGIDTEKDLVQAIAYFKKGKD